MNASSTVVPLAYIGHKPAKTDNVAGTGVVWRGHGDVQMVPAGHLSKFLAHPSVWAIPEDSDLDPDNPDEHGEAGLVGLDRTALRGIAKKLGIAVGPNLSAEKIADRITAKCDPAAIALALKGE